jgi:nicotinamide/nicotinate riboside kinase
MPPKCLLVGLSGPSSSGKTTIARLLRDILPDAFILHEDDFYKTDAEIPINKEYDLADWDCLESINLPALESTLTYIKANGSPPSDLESKEDQNSVGEVNVDAAMIQRLKQQASSLGAKQVRVAIVDGFLLYSQEMEAIRDTFDVKLFLRTDYETAKKRREARSGYVTLEGFWYDSQSRTAATMVEILRLWFNQQHRITNTISIGLIHPAMSTRSCGQTMSTTTNICSMTVRSKAK